MDSFTITPHIHSRAEDCDRVFLFVTPYQQASKQQATSVIDHYLSKMACNHALHAPSLQYLCTKFPLFCDTVSGLAYGNDVATSGRLLLSRYA